MTRLIPLTLIAALGLAACSAAPSVAPSEATAVEIATPTAAGGPTVITAVGRLEADDEAAMGFTSAGVIASMSVDIGDRVRSGQVLARLDSTVLDAEAREAEEQLARSRRDLARLDDLVQRQLVARQQRDDARTGVDVAEARLRAARFGQRFGRLVASAEGTVLARLAEPGEVVAAGQPVLRVSGDSAGWRLPVTVADRDGQRIHTGASAEVRFDAIPGLVLPATVRRVAGEASATSGGIVIELALEGQGVALRSGLVGKARITTVDDGAGVWIPASALLDAAPDGGSVFIVVEGRAERRRVQLGELQAGAVRVMKGLDVVDLVVVGGGAFVVEGATVSVTQRP